MYMAFFFQKNPIGVVLKKRPGSFKFYNGSEWVIFVNSPKEVK